MRCWRITTANWTLDKECIGARREGGRWNPVGYPVMYAGTTIEICALEKYVHLAGVMHPPLRLVSVDIPDDARLLYIPKLSELPDQWAALPIGTESQEFGKRWIEAADTLAMQIPSAIIPEAANIVINPKHSAYRRVQLQIVRDFVFDARMRKA